MTATTFLVTGATGKTGRRVTSLLRAAGHQVREGSRRSQTPFDWDNQETWSVALEGVGAIYAVLLALGTEEAIEQAHHFAQHAALAGARRVVLVSVPDGGGMDTAIVTKTENQFTDAGLELTVLRLRWLSQNFSEDFLLDSVLSGDIRIPAGEGKESFVDADDIAAVAVTALTSDGHNGKSYELTGPEALSFTEVAEQLTAATGRDITYTPLHVDEFIEEQQKYGLPLDVAQMFAGLYEHIATGELSTTTGDIAEVLGRPARNFRSYADAVAASETWKA